MTSDVSAKGSSLELRRSPARFPWRELGFVLVVALGIRALFAILIGDTYDFDEFVLLLLGRDLAHGAVAYRDFMFFHPPGALVVYGVLDPLIAHWWPAARLLSIVVDTATAGLVWRLGLEIWGHREAMAAGLLYAVNPLALLSASRVGQDPLLAFLGILGLVVVLTRRNVPGSLVAGICLGLAIWIKYPAAIFIPVYLLAVPRRVPQWGVVAAVTLAVALLPFLGSWHALFSDTVTFQWTRWAMGPQQRVLTTLLFWIVVNPLAIPGVLARRPPAWALLGFALGGLFAASSQVYYHYFVPVVPFAALLSAPLVLRLTALRPRSEACGRGLQGTTDPLAPGSVKGAPRRLLVTACLILTLAWAYLIGHGGPSPLYVTAAHLSDIAPTVRLIERRTPAGSSILADRFEYAFLAHRQALAHYFWNVGVLIDARYLERRVRSARAVVLSYGASSGYPAGFIRYLDRHYLSADTMDNTIWWIRRRK